MLAGRLRLMLPTQTLIVCNAPTTRSPSSPSSRSPAGTPNASTASRRPSWFPPEAIRKPRSGPRTRRRLGRGVWRRGDGAVDPPEPRLTCEHLALGARRRRRRAPAFEEGSLSSSRRSVRMTHRYHQSLLHTYTLKSLEARGLTAVAVRPTRVRPHAVSAKNRGDEEGVRTRRGRSPAAHRLERAVAGVAGDNAEPDEQVAAPREQEAADAGTGRRRGAPRRRPPWPPSRRERVARRARLVEDVGGEGVAVPAEEVVGLPLEALRRAADRGPSGIESQSSYARTGQPKAIAVEADVVRPRSRRPRCRTARRGPRRGRAT